MRLFVCLFCLFTYSSCWATEDLTFGKYAVGFRSGVYFDASRPPLKEQTQFREKGRPVHIGFWYPGVLDSKKKRLLQQDYSTTILPSNNFFSSTPFPVKYIDPEKNKNAIKDYLLTSLVNLHGDTNTLLHYYDRLMKEPTHAYNELSAVAGRFPVIFFQEDIFRGSILCEFLASHGFIVVAVSGFGAFSNAMEWQRVRGLETLVEDLQFAKTVTEKEFTIENPVFGAMGVGMHASAAVSWAMRDQRLKALASLEGGILTNYEWTMLQQSSYFDVKRLRQDMLVMYSPHAAIDSTLLNRYKYANKHVRSFPQTSEFYYLNYGYWERKMPGILGKAPGDVYGSYLLIAQTTLQFFNEQLKAIPTNHIQSLVSSFVSRNQLIQASEIPPSDDDLLVILQQKGFDTLKKTVDYFLSKDSSAFTYTSFESVARQLINTRAFQDLINWSKPFQQLFPENTLPFSYTARGHFELGNKIEAKKYYQLALTVVDCDLMIPQKQDRINFRNAIEQRIRQL